MKTVANLQKSVRAYLDYPSADRRVLKITLDQIRDGLPESETVIFGGMLRDFSLNDARDFESDIDLVSLASREEIATAIECFSPTRNKFGGFRFTVNKYIFDIWAFKDTWAFREGLVEAIKLEDLLRTTFFNVDASVYSLTSRRCHMSAECSNALESRILDINLAENPSPDRMALRAIRLGREKNFAIGNMLALFLLRNLRLQHLDPVSRRFMLDLKKHVDSGKEGPFKFQFSPQLSLPW